MLPSFLALPPRDGSIVPAGYVSADPLSFCVVTPMLELFLLLIHGGRGWKERGSCAFVSAGWGTLIPSLFVEHLEVFS